MSFALCTWICTPTLTFSSCVYLEQVTQLLCDSSSSCASEDTHTWLRMLLKNQWYNDVKALFKAWPIRIVQCVLGHYLCSSEINTLVKDAYLVTCPINIYWRGDSQSGSSINLTSVGRTSMGSAIATQIQEGPSTPCCNRSASLSLYRGDRASTHMKIIHA